MKRHVHQVGPCSIALLVGLSLGLVKTTSAGKPDPRDPASAIGGIDVAEGLELTLAASEPQLKSLTNLDVDDRGRIWVCEVVNYRGHNGKRPAGDRILILEDKDHDGVCESTKVFYQGRDVDSAMGICVLGDKVIVSCSPNVLVFTDADGDDLPDDKEMLFTKTGRPQHDHSAHSFVFGPDGKLYWNFGNTGQSVHDRNGEIVRDQWGREVADRGKPYFGGMIFRCDEDGSNLEVLAHNFRNNYEVCVDSFGNLWQSDNDDDGNRSVRINYVVEFGNYGYRDEISGAGWGAWRTNMEQQVADRHWHQNDPGVIPNLLVTGAGSPTGITVYEGDLLPRSLLGNVIHCDAGPNVVRCYQTTSNGAGYRAEIAPMLTGVRDQWFRPADVCVAPDGSLFVTDWYDPGVGGHGMRDLERGRLYRVAPPGSAYQVPRYTCDTVDGAVMALQSPNQAVRYKAWHALKKFGPAAENELASLYRSDSAPRFRARALWLLSKLPEQGKVYMQHATKDRDPQLRVVAVRAARQVPDALQAVVARLSGDPDAAVRRACCVALHGNTEPWCADAWADLASSYDGNDRWLLEALGIAADGNWDSCLAAYAAKVAGQEISPATRRILWRSRGTQSAEMIATLVVDQSTPEEERPALLRALDFQSAASRDTAVKDLLHADWSAAASTPVFPRLRTGEAKRAFLQKFHADGFELDSAQARVLWDLLARVDAGIVEADAGQDVVRRALNVFQGDPGRFLELLERFPVDGYHPQVVALAQNPSMGIAARAMRLLMDRKQQLAVRRMLQTEDAAGLDRTLETLKACGHPEAIPLLTAVMDDPERPDGTRKSAARALVAYQDGARGMLVRAAEGKLPPDLVEAVAFPLINSRHQDIRALAGKQFPEFLTPGENLPPLNELIQKTGDVKIGARVFREKGTCAKCHVVKGQGIAVGPDLTEIGSKLGREAMIESILLPNAAVGHGYETYTLVLDSGLVHTGLLVSKSDRDIVIKTADNKLLTFAIGKVEELAAQKKSLMPGDLHRSMSTEEFTGLVEYLMALRRPENAGG